MLISCLIRTLGRSFGETDKTCILTEVCRRMKAWVNLSLIVESSWIRSIQKKLKLLLTKKRTFIVSVWLWITSLQAVMTTWNGLVLNIKETSAHWQVNKHTKNSSYFSVLFSINFLLHTNFIVDYLASMTTFSQSMYPKVQIGATF
jgi:hypothetical protein